MATASQILRIKKLRGPNIIRVAAKHNLREIQAEIGAGGDIDASRIHLNTVIAGALTADDVFNYADHLMSESNIKRLRKDAVRGLEIVVSLPPTSTANRSLFFDDVLAWVKEYYALPVLSAVVHNDEQAPHCHIILLPLIDGRMNGSDVVGYVARMQAMQMNFHERVGRNYGLSRPKKQPRLSAATRKKSASLALSAIQSDPTLMDRPEVESALLAVFENDPSPLLTSLGMEIPYPPKTTRSFVQIMTKPVKPEKSSRFSGSPIPIEGGFDTRENPRTLSCVGFADATPSISSEKQSQPLVVHDNIGVLFQEGQGAYESCPLPLPSAISELQRLAGNYVSGNAT